MDIGSIGAIALNEKDQTKINFAIQQLIARNSGAQINAVVAKSAAYTLQPSDFMVEVTGNTTITLPAASAAPGQIYCIKKMDSGNTVTIGGTVDGVSNPTITVQYEVMLIQSSGTVWDRIVKYTAPVSTSGLLQDTNNLSDVDDAAIALGNLGGAPLASPALTGNPTAPTQSPGTNNTRLASTAYADAAVAALVVTGRLVVGTALVLNPYANSTTATQAHGLGAEPVIIAISFECLNATQNYSAGDKIRWWGGYIAPWVVLCDTTNVVLVTSTTTPQIPNKTTYTNAAINVADWKLTITPYELV